MSAPAGENARVIAMGNSKTTGRPFNIAVAFDPGEEGPALAHSTFHHFADYNWDPRSGSPSFVTEAPGDAIIRDPRALGGYPSLCPQSGALACRMRLLGAGHAGRNTNHFTELRHRIISWHEIEPCREIRCQSKPAKPR